MTREQAHPQAHRSCRVFSDEPRQDRNLEVLITIGSGFHHHNSPIDIGEKPSTPTPKLFEQPAHLMSRYDDRLTYFSAE
jgi:hypothetical protein